MYTILSKDELPSLLEDFTPGRAIPSLIRKLDAEKFGITLMAETSILDTFKIYIDPKLWTYFWIYRAFCGRLVNFVNDCKAKGKIRHWTEDAGLKDLLDVVMTEMEMKTIYGNYLNSLQYTFDIIEQKMINEITELTTGKKQTISYLEQMKEFNRMIAINKIGV